MKQQSVDPAAPGRPEPGRAQRPTRVQFRSLTSWMALTDWTAILAAMLATYAIRFGLRPNPDGYNFLALFVVAPPLWVAILAALRTYSVSRLSPAEEFKRVFYAITIGVTGIVTVSYWTKAELSRFWVGASWVLSIVAVLAVRRVWRAIVARRQARGGLALRTVILGTNEEAVHIAGVMRARPLGFEPAGFVLPTGAEAAATPLPVLGAVADLPAVIAETGAECVWVASSGVGAQDVRAVTKLARSGAVDVRVSANIPEMMASRLAAQPFGGLMAFSIWPVRLSRFQAALKRTFDLVVAGVLLLLLAPLLAGIALAVRLDSPGPVLFRQRRVGRGGRPFTLLKYRTMVLGAEGMSEALQDRNEATGPLFKIRDDRRLTRVGRWLRRWSLDELPQLVNVLRGDMSLVGPRPPLPSEVASYEDWHRERLEVRPGMTGLWQVSGRSELSFDDYVRLDLFYIENWSLAYDLYLIVKTIPAVISGRGAY